MLSQSFIKTFVEGAVLETTAVAAEMAKLVENSFRDVNIAFANELSIMAEKFNADPIEIIELANRHPRVNILNPGPGVGGHCISVDPWFLVHALPEKTNLIRTAREVNDSKPAFVVERAIAEAEKFKSPIIGCLGLAYKADVDDLRESPSLEIVRQLQKQNRGELLVCEPYVTEKTFTEFPLSSLEETLERSDILLLLTDHQEFKQVTVDQLAGKVIIDTRAVWRPLIAELESREEAPTLSVYTEESRRAA